MIENIRKYRGLIFLGLALVVFGLVLGLKDDVLRGGIGGAKMLKIDGRTYTDKEFGQFGSAGLDLVSGLASAGDSGLYQYLFGLTAGATSRDDGPEAFFIARMVLRSAADEFGIFPSDKEVFDRLRTMRAFTTPEGGFDEAAYRRLVERRIGRYGLTEADLLELMSDIIAFEKLTEVIGSGLEENRDTIASMMALQNQRITGELARIDIDSYESAIEPTDEEIREYWENLQDSFVTEATRKFTYLIVTPVLPEEPADEPESLADAAASDEQKKEKEAEKARLAAERADERRKKQIETDNAVDTFSFELEEQQGEGFEELAQKNGWEVRTSEFFPRTEPPEDLNVTLRSSSRGGMAVEELFRIEPTSDPISRISQPIAIGENQWLVARLEDEQTSRPKSFEEAKAEARDQYIQENAAEALKNAADEAHEKIKAALEAGQSFAEAAAGAGIEETRAFEDVTSFHRPDPSVEPGNLFEAARNADPGTLADPIIEADRAFLLLVSTREVVKEPGAAERIDQMLAGSARGQAQSAFSDWLASRIEAAKIERYYGR